MSGWLTDLSGLMKGVTSCWAVSVHVLCAHCAVALVVFLMLIEAGYYRIVLYHYTSMDGMNSIRKNEVIKKSIGSANNPDVLLGEGVYLTALQPSLGKVRLSLNNYDRLDLGKSVIHICIYAFTSYII